LSAAATDRPHSTYLTLVLVAFKKQNGLKVLKDFAELFMTEIRALPAPSSVPQSDKEIKGRLASAYGGIKIILALFAELASGKSIVESSQTQAMTSHHDRDRDRPDYFQPGQFLVDLRMEILPLAQNLWNSEFATQSESPVISAWLTFCVQRWMANTKREHFTVRIRLLP
jgi:E3 ubiquitin-protein ligase HUWE1